MTHPHLTAPVHNESNIWRKVFESWHILSLPSHGWICTTEAGLERRGCPSLCARQPIGNSLAAQIPALRRIIVITLEHASSVSWGSISFCQRQDYKGWFHARFSTLLFREEKTGNMKKTIGLIASGSLSAWAVIYFNRSFHRKSYCLLEPALCSKVFATTKVLGVLQGLV